MCAITLFVIAALLVAACGFGPRVGHASGSPVATVVLVAEDLGFDQGSLQVPAGGVIAISLENRDPGILHNVAIYPTVGGDPVFRDVYPEFADDTSSLGSLLAGGERPSGAACRRLARERRQVLEIPRTIGITEIQRRVASILEEVGEGRPTAIYSSGKYVGFLITPAEYYRLRKLSRVVTWFRTAGLDLATADVPAIVDFVRRFLDAPGTATGSAVG
jgi:hypothetical protein